MKRITNIFDRIVSVENLRAAHYEVKASHKPTRRRRAVAYEVNLEENLERLHDDLMHERWRMHPYKAMVRYERGKRREIYYSPNHEDSIVQHALVRVLAPLMKARFIRDTYASIKGRGTMDGVNRIKAFLQSIPPGEPIVVLKGDVKQCYANIRHDALMMDIWHYIKDSRAIRLLVFCFVSHHTGIPIGNPISPLLANLHFSQLDHAAKEKFRFRGYFRYLDDIVVIDFGAKAKRRLKAFIDFIRAYLAVRGLELKKNVQVFPITRPGGLDFLGFRFTRTKITLRKRTERRFRRAVCRFYGLLTDHERASIASYWGVIKQLSHWYRFWFTFFPQNVHNLEVLQ